MSLPSQGGALCEEKEGEKKFKQVSECWKGIVSGLKYLQAFFILGLHEVKGFHLNFISQWMSSTLIASLGHVPPDISLIPSHLTFHPQGSMTHMSYLRIS